MELVNQNSQNGAFSARGICPHCSVPSYHSFVVGPYVKHSGDAEIEGHVLVECQNCQHVMYVVGKRKGAVHFYEYKESFPLGNPESSVETTIMSGVRDDFIEALKCKSISAHKATVVMCRRALQASCKQFGAEGAKLINQIDDLSRKGRITTALKDMAHDIRKLGNDGAHPDEDGLGEVTKEDAEDIVEFTRQYFEHVYVMPARSDAFRKRREAVGGATVKPAGA
jgi:Domain of unknown function (DUF4145)